jgi:hypothetical protein
MHFFSNRPILKYGLISAIFYWTVTLVLTFAVERSLLLISFYAPGMIFGICLLYGFDEKGIENKVFPLSIVFLSPVFYMIILFFCGRNISFDIQARHFLSCGIGAVLLFFAIFLSYRVSFSFYDYLRAFIVGLATTFFMWIDKFDNFNPWLMLFCIGLWQIAISFLLDRKLDKNNLIK